jgi:EF-P beta-lysylation protein EpmB
MSSSSNPEPKTAILARTPASPHRKSWQQQLAEGFRDPARLLAHLQLPASRLVPAQRAAAAFPLRVPRYFADLMTPGDPHDPLLRQVLPVADELVASPGFSTDPVGDMAARAGHGLLQKYRGRALLITTGACAVHCRYCFRRHYPYSDEQAGRDDWSPVLVELARRPDISEIILSGGDPLSLSDQRLASLLEGLAAVPGLRRLRIHSRLPVVLPARLTTRLTSLLAGNRLATSLVLHANHSRELTGTLAAALGPLRDAGVTLLNQAVLLAGVNDDARVLADLSETLFDLGILPYYLHQLDPVAGAAHFQVDEERARALHRQLRDTLPGYLLPRLVHEVAGGAAKLPL